MEFVSEDLLHSPKQHRFYFEDKQGTVLSYLDYQLKKHLDPTEVVFHFVFTPPEYRGQSIARKLSYLAFDFAETEGWNITATCPYVRSYHNRWLKAKQEESKHK